MNQSNLSYSYNNNAGGGNFQGNPAHQIYQPLPFPPMALYQNQVHSQQYQMQQSSNFYTTVPASPANKNPGPVVEKSSSTQDEKPPQNSQHDESAEEDPKQSETEQEESVKQKKKTTTSKASIEIKGIIPYAGPSKEHLFVCCFAGSDKDVVLTRKKLRKRYPMDLIKFYEKKIIGIHNESKDLC